MLRRGQEKVGHPGHMMSVLGGHLQETFETRATVKTSITTGGCGYYSRK